MVERFEEFDFIVNHEIKLKLSYLLKERRGQFLSYSIPSLIFLFKSIKFFFHALDISEVLRLTAFVDKLS